MIVNVNDFLVVSGFEVNVGFLGVQSLDNFLDLLTAADTEDKLLDALKFKSRCSQKINDDIVKFRMQEAMTMTKPRLKGFNDAKSQTDPKKTK